MTSLDFGAPTWTSALSGRVRAKGPERATAGEWLVGCVLDEIHSVRKDSPKGDRIYYAGDALGNHPSRLHRPKISGRATLSVLAGFLQWHQLSELLGKVLPRFAKTASGARRLSVMGNQLPAAGFGFLSGGADIAAFHVRLAPVEPLDFRGPKPGEPCNHRERGYFGVRCRKQPPQFTGSENLEFLKDGFLNRDGVHFVPVRG